MWGEINCIYVCKKFTGTSTTLYYNAGRNVWTARDNRVVFPENTRYPPDAEWIEVRYRSGRVEKESLYSKEAIVPVAVNTAGSPPKVCAHTWVTTQGLVEIWEDCSACGAKKEDTLEELPI